MMRKADMKALDGQWREEQAELDRPPTIPHINPIDTTELRESINTAKRLERELGQEKKE